ncbi:MAG: NAD-dependent epimerase/dehydratase family protein [Bacteroidota bacterium]|nr:NAD-dependent epimerase/dehydratase family protein [Bacteroidota bacterium]
MVFVTGGTGLVGSHLLFELIKKGEKVRALRRESSSISLTKKIFSYYDDKFDELFNKIEWVEGDMLDYLGLEKLFDDIDNVYHCAATVSFDTSDHEQMINNNVKGTENLINISIDKNIRKFAYVSSIATLGRAKNENKITNENTDMDETGEISVYSLSKYLAEKEVWRGIAEGLNAVIVNPSIIIGPGDWSKGSCQMFQVGYKGLKYYTKGVNGFVDVRDVAKILVLLMSSEISNERFILSSENVSYRKLYDDISLNFNFKKPYIKVNPFLSGIAWRIEKLKSLIAGLKPLITKETARTANQKYFYSNERIVNAINYKFIPVSESIKHTCSAYLKDNRLNIKI